MAKAPQENEAAHHSMKRAERPGGDGRAKATLRILERIRDLPTLPAVAMKAMQVIADADSSAQDLARIISYDQATSARLLRVANSAYYGFRHKVSTVPEAIIILGFTNVQSLILTTSVLRTMRGGRAGGFDRLQFWQHSVGCGIVSQMLAAKVHHPRPGDVFTAGILHDLGRIILDQYLHEEFLTIIKLMAEKGLPSTAAEKEVLGIDHAEMGGLLVKSWGLPPSLVDATTFHHSPMAASEDVPAAALVYLGDAYCIENGLHPGVEEAKIKPSPEVFHQLGLTEGSVASALPPFTYVEARARAFLALT
ncbi:MAG: HDOD domain-containing protein [Chloroflexi bacterium]|nr:HDOD domain-containing protein [Chloroflexota bacterium]